MFIHSIDELSGNIYVYFQLLLNSRKMKKKKKNNIGIYRCIGMSSSLQTNTIAHSTSYTS